MVKGIETLRDLHLQQAAPGSDELCCNHQAAIHTHGGSDHTKTRSRVAAHHLVDFLNLRHHETLNSQSKINKVGKYRLHF